MMGRQRRGGKQTSDAKRCDTVALMGESQTCLVPSKRLAVSRPGARQLVSQLKVTSLSVHSPLFVSRSVSAHLYETNPPLCLGSAPRKPRINSQLVAQRWLSSTPCLPRPRRSGGRGASARQRNVQTAKESAPSGDFVQRWSVQIGRRSGEKEKSDTEQQPIKDKPDRERGIIAAVTKKPSSKKTRPKTDNHQSPPSEKHSIQSGKSVTKTNKNSHISSLRGLSHLQSARSLTLQVCTPPPPPVCEVSHFSRGVPPPPSQSARSLTLQVCTPPPFQSARSLTSPVCEVSHFSRCVPPPPLTVCEVSHFSSLRGLSLLQVCTPPPSQSARCLTSPGVYPPPPFTVCEVSHFSRPRLKNIDRSTAQQLAITVGNVTVIITDFKEKTRSSSTSSSTITSSVGSEHQHQSSGSESMDKGSSRASTPKGELSVGHDESF
ncbi:hypothetical protein KUCAC02_031183 [Chaenocephalus aceratus]|uniref:Uncharacterized protein n=1 Tax=Chaenocephalus aceratus TaxID=36190 RepID=A0ACB9XKZ4_CHAAC|nr:hypothetical protein KUCAC02_031183 [Chaenocephalus aceratus]